MEPAEQQSSGPAQAKPPSHREDALAIVARLREGGHVAYFAGGCVRDLLLGKTPKDYDVATDAPPPRVRQLFASTQSVGAAFGVILVRHRRSVVEVATFRSDGRYLDGRRPSQVSFTTAEHDAQRRDFTINGLFLDPLDDRVIDFVGGQKDLADRVIRAIGNADDRFEEDHLRMLRAIRFASRLGFVIEPVTAQAIVRHGPQLARISPERIAEELRMMLTQPTRSSAYRLLEELGLRASFFRFHASAKSPTGKRTSAAVFDAVDFDGTIPFGLSLAAAGLDQQLWTSSPAADPRAFLERPSAQRLVQSLRQSLKISNEESDDVLGALEGLSPLLRDDRPRIATLKRFLARPTADLSRTLLRALGKTVLRSARISELEHQLAELEQTDFAPLPLITGDDLTASGLSPGPLFKKILDAVYDAQLEQLVQTRDEAMELARNRAGEKGQSV
jgi:poly(A) polymerase